MERKIGEIFKHKGEWYQAVEGIGCRGCDFKCVIPSPLIKGCATLNFKKLEKVGEPYELFVKNRGIILLQKYKMLVEPYINGVFCNIHYEDNTIDIELKQNKEDMEKKKLNLKPFDLEAAKKGKPVCTRDGRKARIICFNAKRKDEKSIIALVPSKDFPGFEDLITYPNNGNYHGGHENDGDLMMLPEKKEGWVNVYNNPTTHSIYTSADVFESKEIAEEQGTQRNRIATCKITWEE